MATEPVRAVDVLSSWVILDTAFTTTDAPRLWAEHWALVVRLRRRYARVATGLGVLSGGLSALNTALFADFGSHVPAALVMLVVGLLLPWAGLSFQRAWVAPIMQRDRQLWTLLFSLLAYYLVVGVALYLDPGPLWTVAAGVLAALPWWISAGEELAKPSPAYPAEWMPFLID